MKHRLYLVVLLAAITLSGMAQTIGEAFYIYRNDGGFNAFFRDEVISIEYSYEDAEGNTYDEIVTQIVNTADSVYKIPLAAIDSVGFVTPETQYQPGVKVIEGDLRQYVLSSNDLDIVLTAQTPSNILPQVGDRLITLEQSETFPIGFMGEVIDVTSAPDGNYIVNCKAVSMTDVFKCYYGISDSNYSGHINSIRTRDAGSGHAIFTPGPFRFPLTGDWSQSIDLGDDFAYTCQPNFVFEFAPTFNVEAFVIIPGNGDDECYISMSCVADFHFVEHIGGSGSLQWNHDWGWKKTIPETDIDIPVLSWPIPQCPLARFYIEPGVFLRASAQLSSQLEFTQKYRLVFHYDVSSQYGQSMKPAFIARTIESSVDGELTLNGSISIGGYTEMGFLFLDKDFAHICFRGELGFEGESNAVLLKKEVSTAFESTEVYDRLHNTALNINWFYGTSIEGKIWPFSVSYALPLSRKDPIASLGYVPTFQDVTLKKYSSGSVEAKASVEVDGMFSRLMQPVRIGFSLRDEEGHVVGTYYEDKKYQSGKANLSHVFNNLKQGTRYIVYPIVNLNGVEMLASPFASETENNNTKAITKEVVRVDQNYAIVKGEYEGIKDVNGICGIEYWSDEDETHQEITSDAEADGEYEFGLDLIPGTVYYYRAFIKTSSDYIRASETKSFESGYNPNVIITDFKQNASYNIPNYFMEIGGGERQYDYKYFTQFTIQTGDLENIEFLGCLYKGPSGEFLDTYLYYNGQPSETGEVHFNNMVSNSAEESLVIIPYAMVDDGGNNGYHKEYGKKMVFSLRHDGNNYGCQDDNHPHAIDLGLGNGVIVSCCNLGASRPEEVGNYYAWGETKPKASYTPENYAYGEDWEHYSIIAQDFGGTSNDAAHVNWGGNWRMPNKEELESIARYNIEFIKKISVNGKEGFLFVHLNGNHVYFPITGRYIFGQFDTMNSGCYWASSSSGDPDMLYIYEASYGSEPRMFNWHPSAGLAIRPIMYLNDSQ